jgi:hypothetical protein
MVEEKEVVQYSACVRHLLEGKSKMKKMDKSAACEGCASGGCLCARLQVSNDGEARLAVYPLPESLREDVDWIEMAFWARK